MITHLLIVCVALTQPPDLNDSIALLDRLDGTLISVDYDNQPLRTIVSDLTAKLPASLFADWPALERLGVYGERRVTLRMNLTSATTVLAALTMTLGDELERPVIESHAGQVVLTTVAGSMPLRTTAVYDVRDLLANESLLKRLRESTLTPPIEPQDQQQPDEKRGDEQPRQGSDAADPGLGEPAPAQGDAPAPPPSPMLTPGEKLLLVITDHVDPEAWINFGGNRGLITEMNGVLMVTATPSTHRRLQSAIRSLRAAAPTSISIEAAIIDLPRSDMPLLVRQSGSNALTLAQSILQHEHARRLWETSGAVAIDAPLQIESSSADQSIRLSLQPTFDHATGVLEIAVDVTVAQGADKRVLKTVAALSSDFSAAALELPASRPGNEIRLLVLKAQRR